MKIDLTEFSRNELYLTVSNGKAYAEVWQDAINRAKEGKGNRYVFKERRVLRDSLLRLMCDECFVFTDDQWDCLIEQIEIL